jgi:hypothetical protein
MKTWAQGPIDVSAPLATWSRLLFSDVSDRRTWLEKLAAEGTNRIVVQALLQLLEQFPDGSFVEFTVFFQAISKLSLPQ